MVQRADVQFNSGHERISAWLYRPQTTGEAPLLVMAHGLGGVRAMRLDAYAERFCAAGFACLVFDYRNFGDSEGEPRQVLDIGMQLQDWAAAVAYARTLPGIDNQRIGLWGTSFSGGHVIATAARLPGIAAVVAQCPFTDGIASARTLNPLVTARITALAVRDLAATRLGRPPVMVPVVSYPDEVALMNAPDAYPGFLRLVPDGMQIRNEVAARFGIKVLTYRPGRAAAKVTCPILFCVCERDSVAPAAATVRHAAKAPRSEIKVYPEGHFGIYVGDAFRPRRRGSARLPRHASEIRRSLAAGRAGAALGYVQSVLNVYDEVAMSPAKRSSSTVSAYSSNARCHPHDGPRLRVADDL